MAGESGCRNWLVTLQQRPVADAVGGSGFPVDTWTTLGTIWMERENTRGSERFTADQLSSRGDVTWTMPYQVTMDPELVDVPKLRRLVYQGRIFDVLSATLVGGWHDRIELATMVTPG